MSEESAPVCIRCGNPVTDPPRIQYLASGEACYCCRDRYVDSLPSLLPAEVEEGELDEVADHDSTSQSDPGYSEGGFSA